MTDDERAELQVAGFLSAEFDHPGHPSEMLPLARRIVAVVRSSDDEWEMDE